MTTDKERKAQGPFCGHIIGLRYMVSPVFLPSRITLAITTLLLPIVIYSCKTSPTELIIHNNNSDTTVQFVSRGLQGFTVVSLRESKQYIYACTGKDGLFRIRKKSLGVGYWEYLGLKTTQLGTHGVMDVAILGDNDDVICAGIGNDKTYIPGLWRSIDQGMTWTRSDSNLMGGYAGAPDLVNVYSASYLAVSPATPGLIFTCNWWNSAVYWSHDSGAHWSRTSNIGLRGYFMDFMEIEPKRPERIWAAGYLQRSTDNGVSWLFLNTYSDVFPVQGISSLAFGSIGEVYASQADRIVHSTDDGQTWTMLMKADSAVTLCSVLVDPEDADHTIVSGFSYAEDSKANILSEKTYIYNFENRALRQIYEHDGIVVTRHLRALNNHGLLFGTGGDGVYEITNIMKQ